MTLPWTALSATLVEGRSLCEPACSRWLRPVPDVSRRLAEHVSAIDVLAERGGEALVAGTAVVATFVALRMALMPGATDAENASW